MAGASGLPLALQRRGHIEKLLAGFEQSAKTQQFLHEVLGLKWPLITISGRMSLQDDV